MRFSLFLAAMVVLAALVMPAMADKVDDHIVNLKDKHSWVVRYEAARALALIGDTRAVDPLIEALRDDDSGVRGMAASGLGSIGDPRAVDPLIESLKDEGAYVRWSAADALGWIGDARAVDPLINALKDKDEIVRRSAADALRWIGDARAVDPLIGALRDENANVREYAARALGKIGDSRAVDPLIEALKDEDKDVQAEAARALGEIGDARAVDPLIGALKDENWEIRLGAAWALGRIGDTRAVDPLIKTLKDEYEDARMNAAMALGEIGDSRAIDPLIEALQDEDKWIRLAAAWALGKIADVRAVDPLILALRDEAEDVRREAAWALGRIGDTRAVDPLIEALKDEYVWVRMYASMALGEIGDSRAVDPLIEALKDENSNVRLNAADALGEIGDHRAVEPLTYVASRDMDEMVQKAALKALDMISGGQSEAKEGEIASYETALEVNSDWYDSLVWLRENTPHLGIDINSSYERPPLGEKSLYPDSAYWIMSWWEYGYWIESIGERLPNSKPFQQGIGNRETGDPGSSPFFLAQNEAEAEDVAAGLDIDRSPYSNIRYVVTDVEMAMGKFHAIAAWSNINPGNYLFAYWQNNQPITIYRTPYFRSMVARLHFFDGTETDVQEGWVMGFRFDGQGEVTAEPQKRSGNYQVLLEGVNESLQRGYAAAEVVTQSPVMTSVPLEALGHYRLVYESQSSVTTSGQKYVKIFEHVPGATIFGEAPPGTYVVISVPITTNRGRNFLYQQSTVADSDGEFSLIVPYSTEGPEDWSTNFETGPAGPYTLRVGDLRYDVRVPEGAIIAGSSVSLNFESVDDDLGAWNQSDFGVGGRLINQYFESVCDVFKMYPENLVFAFWIDMTASKDLTEAAALSLPPTVGLTYRDQVNIYPSPIDRVSWGLFGDEIAEFHWTKPALIGAQGLAVLYNGYQLAPVGTTEIVTVLGTPVLFGTEPTVKSVLDVLSGEALTTGKFVLPYDEVADLQISALGRDAIDNPSFMPPLGGEYLESYLGVSTSDGGFSLTVKYLALRGESERRVEDLATGLGLGTRREGRIVTFSGSIENERLAETLGAFIAP